MLGHVGLNVPDLAGAQAYYDDLLPLLGFEAFLIADDQCAYKPAGAKPGTYLFLYPAADPMPYSRDRTGLQHLAFMVSTRGDVDRVHRHVLSVDGKVIHPPRVFRSIRPRITPRSGSTPSGSCLKPCATTTVTDPAGAQSP